MEEFYKILSARHLQRHNGEPLWKYNISNDEFNYLKSSFKTIDSSKQLKPKDCALYYAEWWKRFYNGGYPSKESIYNSLGLNNNYFSAEDLFKSAKIGGDILGYKWIQNQNRLFFKSLLLQGGLPINLVKNNSGNYRNFLLNILDLNPFSVDDFSQRTDITCLLPKSSQNDIVYESCLQIVRAILDDNEDSILEFSKNTDLDEITKELISKRKSASYKKAKIKFRFHLHPNENKLKLKLSLPTSITTEDFSILLNNSEEHIHSNEFNLFINGDLIAKFIKRNDRSYKVQTLTSEIDITENVKPEISLIDGSNSIFYCDHLADHFINTEQPSLWTKIDTDSYVLQKSRKTILEEAYVLVPNNDSFRFEKMNNKIALTLFDEDFEFIKFDSKISISSTFGGTFNFYCNAKNSFDWHIYSANFDWIYQANSNIVVGKINAIAFNEIGDKISNLRLKYKAVNSENWVDYAPDSFLPIGSLDIMLESNGEQEFDTVFNIGNLKLEYRSDIKNPKISIIKPDSLKVEIYNALSYNFTIKDNEIDFQLVENASLPTSIKLRLCSSSQNRGLILKVKSPFQGISIVDPNNNEIEDTKLYADNLKGFRLVTNTNQSKYEAVFYNLKNDKLRISRDIKRNVTSLQEFQSIFEKLFRLFNIIDPDNIVIIKLNEIGINDTSKNIKTFKLQQFSSQLKWHINEGSKIIFETNEQVNLSDLFVIPLDCPLEKIDKIGLIENEDYFEISNEVSDKYVIFSNSTAVQKIKPEFISIDPQNTLTDHKDRLARIDGYKNQLLENEFDTDIWNKFLTYYYLCSENNLPFSTFDILKAVSISSKLAAKAFYFLVLNLDNNVKTDFSSHSFADFQNDIGFSFNWVSKKDWQEFLPTHCIHTMLPALSRMNQTMSSTFIINDGCILKDFGLNKDFSEVRARLGHRVLSELPTYQIEYIPKEHKKKIPNIDSHENLTLLASFPLLLALSISDESDSIWHAKGDSTRRKILYLMELDQQWYSTALHYYLNQLKN